MELMKNKRLTDGAERPLASWAVARCLPHHTQTRLLFRDQFGARSLLSELRGSRLSAMYPRSVSTDASNLTHSMSSRRSAGMRFDVDRTYIATDAVQDRDVARQNRSPR
jgi:hypothetical protein